MGFFGICLLIIGILFRRTELMRFPVLLNLNRTINQCCPQKCFIGIATNIKGRTQHNAHPIVPYAR